MTHRFRGACILILFAAICWLPAGSHAQTPAVSHGRRGSTWQVLGRSLEDRVIEYRQFGEGQRQVLVVGPLEGDETAGLELVESLAEHLERFPRRASGVQVTVVRDPNPDGRLRRTAANARGVLIDRNFPTRSWRKLPSGSLWLSGREPESEPETRALIDLLGDVRPDCMIVLASARRQAELTYFGPAEELARELAKLIGLRPGAANLTAEQGSLAVYTGADRSVPTIVLRVPAGMRSDLVWTTYKRGLLAAIGAGNSDEDATQGMPDSGVAEQNVPQPPAPQTMLTMSKRPLPQDGQSNAAPMTPRALAVDNLESAGKLVPVAPVRREYGPAVISPPAVLPRTAQPAARPPIVSRRATIRANSPGAFPPATLVRPLPTRLNPVPPSTMPSKALNVPGTAKVERFPAVDPAAPPAALRGAPQPIPVYPETGY